MHGVAETAGGVLLAVGLLTPLAAAAILAVMLNAAVVVHARNGVWVSGPLGTPRLGAAGHPCTRRLKDVVTTRRHPPGLADQTRPGDPLGAPTTARAVTEVTKPVQPPCRR